MYNHITLKELRPMLPKVIEKIDSKLDRYIISKRGEPIAVLLSIDDFESLMETLNEVSDRENLKNIKKAMRETKTVDWNQIKKKYNL